jgi:hypothetical protein
VLEEALDDVLVAVEVAVEKHLEDRDEIGPIVKLASVISGVRSSICQL